MAHKRSKIIDDAESELTGGLGSIQDNIFKRVTNILSKFPQKSGNLKYDRETVKLINQLTDSVEQAIKRSKYPETVNDYLLNFDKISEANILLQKTYGITVKPSMLTSLQRGVLQQATNNLLGSGLDINFVQPVKDAMFQHAVAGASIADTELYLRDIISGNSDRLGLLERYVTQISRDSLSQYDGLIQSRLLKEFDLDCLSFEGSIIKDSRAACVRAVNEFNGILKVEDLQEHIDWAYANSSGMIANTTPDNFPANRFGYNCRHTVSAVRC